MPIKTVRPTSKLYTWGVRHMDMTMNGYIGNIDLDLKPRIPSAFRPIADPKNYSWEFKAMPYFTYVDDFIDADRCPVSLDRSCSKANLTATDSFVYLQYANHDARLWDVDVSGRTEFVK
jgi:iron complex outermembrane receptor protein